MVATTTGDRLEEIAQDLFEVFTQLCLAALRGLRRAGEPHPSASRSARQRRVSSGVPKP